MSAPGAPDPRYALRQRLGLFLGAGLFALLLLLPPPGDLRPDGWRTAAVALLMATWWMTEAIPIPATALLPLVLFPALDVLSMPDAAAPYANEVIYLFFGGFVIALSIERWGLHRRIALGMVAAMGVGARRLVLGFMAATAFLSMWISNTATTTMMLPIALAIGEMFRPVPEEAAGGTEEVAVEAPSYNFGRALMLGIAYAASIGGVATLIGTPPNAVFAAAAEELLDRQVGFLEWMAVGVPVAALLLPLAWALLVFRLYPPEALGPEAAGLLSRERRALGPMNRGERIVGTVFALTALAWVMRAPKALGPVTIPGLQSFAPAIRDSTIAMAAAVLLFVLPVDWRRGVFAMDWRTTRRLPWGVLILFGGGLSLARAMDRSGLAEWIGTLVAGLGNLPTPAIVLVVAALFIFLTELTSNTATTTMAMPVMAGAAVGLGLEPLGLMATAAIGASMAFMLPVATPPNAIVFGSGYLTIPDMARAGIRMNLLSVAAVTAAALLLVPRL